MTPIVSRPLTAILLLSLTAVMTPTSADESDLPAVKTQGNVTYLSGGIGSDETAAIKAAAPGYPLTLQFSSSTGAYLASVVVKITDAAGNVVLDTTTEGPYLLVKLEPGRYTVDAMLDGIDRGTEVTIKAGAPQKRSLIWPPRRSDPEPRTVPSSPGASTAVPNVPSMTTTATITPTGEVITTPSSPSTRSLASPAPSASALPTQTTEGGIPYVTGGIGSDESEAIKAQFSKYAIALTFATMQNGHNVFLASVPVKILDASGATVLDVTTGGPYLLVDVPPGKYQVVATHQGREQRGAVEVGPDRRAERSFVWSTTTTR
ncbi:MAG: putative exported protein [Panacagrimonas sp.]|nr:carboxypeptidase regulatory-like domain-containing protein [Panacagrimonas sp.]MCC2656210.1 putative exported protein [Panacagrimonas sp.]